MVCLLSAVISFIPPKDLKGTLKKLLSPSINVQGSYLCFCFIIYTIIYCTQFVGKHIPVAIIQGEKTIYGDVELIEIW